MNCKAASLLCFCDLLGLSRDLTGLWQVTLDGQHYSTRVEATVVLRKVRTQLPLSSLMDPAFDGADRIEAYSGPTFDFDGVRQVLAILMLSFDGRSIDSELIHFETDDMAGLCLRSKLIL